MNTERIKAAIDEFFGFEAERFHAKDVAIQDLLKNDDLSALIRYLVPELVAQTEEMIQNFIDDGEKDLAEDYRIQFINSDPSSTIKHLLLDAEIGAEAKSPLAA